MEQGGVVLSTLFDVRKIYSLFEYRPFLQGIRQEDEQFSFWELVWVKDGCSVFRAGQYTLELHAGTLAILPPDTPHSCLNAKRDTLLFYLTFYCGSKDLERLASRPIFPTEEERMLLEKLSSRKTAFRWPGEVCGGNGMLLDGAPSPSLLSSLKLQTESLLTLLYENHPAPLPMRTSSGERHSMRLLSQAIAVMEAHTDGSITPDSLADTMHISVSALRKLFHDGMGTGVVQCYTRIRIDKAKQILQTGEKNVSQVAELLGYSSPFYFSRVFKEMTGLSPSAYLRETD